MTHRELLGATLLSWALAVSPAAWGVAPLPVAPEDGAKVVNGMKVVCEGGVCRMVDDDAPVAPTNDAKDKVINDMQVVCEGGVCRMVAPAASTEPAPSPTSAVPAPRLAQGYMSAAQFVAFLENREAASPLADAGLWLTLLFVLLGGLAMNLTPCVLPMIPINLVVIGRSASRGAAYGLGIAVAYGALGVAAAFGGLAFGTIQGNPWFNVGVALVFVLLALALLDVFFLDFSRFRPKLGVRQPSRSAPGETDVPASIAALVRPLFLGALSAVLAGACVAPVLVSVLLLTADGVAKGHRLAALLPFVMGMGMALPWPFVGAGLKILPKPGGWMKGVNRLFAVVVFGFAAWYGILAWKGFFPNERRDGQSIGVDELEVALARAKRPVLVDCWATWCKNCAAMDAVLAEPDVKAALKPFTVIRVQAEDVSALRRVGGLGGVTGLPAFAIYE